MEILRVSSYKTTGRYTRISTYGGRTSRLLAPGPIPGCNIPGCPSVAARLVVNKRSAVILRCLCFEHYVEAGEEFAAQQASERPVTETVWHV